MAVTCCSAAHATLPAINKASSSLNTRNSPLRYNLHSLASRRPSLSRKFYTTRASVVRESEKKVVVEQTFPPKTSTLDQQDGRGGSQKDPPQTSWDRSIIKIEQSINIFLTDSVIKILDTFYQDRDYARFYVLETIARELGGNNWWFDRFLAQHVAVFYYFMTVFMYALSPRMAYELKELPAPEVAVRYYTGGDLYLFDTLYDTFVNIREDEGEHCKTMKACQTPGNLHSPHAYSDDDDAAGEDDECVVSEVECQGIVDCIKKSVSSGPTKQKV
ncbi:Ubiquinol oxidase 4, chloroplastic/chromoplastic [Linum perenne]